MKHIGDMIITSGDGAEYAHITEVTGDVQASGTAQATLPALTKCRDVWAYGTAQATLPALTKCRDVWAYGTAQVALPALTTCEGVRAYGTAQVALPALTKCRDVRASGTAQATLPALTKCRDVRAYGTAQVALPLVGEMLCSDGEFGLFRKHSGTYHAGCRQGLTAEQALEHWGGRTDARAALFTAAIKKAEATND